MKILIDRVFEIRVPGPNQIPDDGPTFTIYHNEGRQKNYCSLKSDSHVTAQRGFQKDMPGYVAAWVEYFTDNKISVREYTVDGLVRVKPDSDIFPKFIEGYIWASFGCDHPSKGEVQLKKSRQAKPIHPNSLEDKISA